MSELQDVIHTLIDVVSGAQAHLSPHEAAVLHDAVEADAQPALDGPDVAPEPDGSDAAPAGGFTSAAPAGVFTSANVTTSAGS
jgi:hypothetical protein